VALPAFAAARRAAALLLLTAGPPDVQQQTRSSRVRRTDGTYGRTDRCPTVA